MSLALLSGFSFPEKNNDIFVKTNADETMMNLTNMFSGLDKWSFDKEQKAWLNSGFEIFLNEKMTEIEYIKLKGLSKDATYSLMDTLGIYPTSITKYILENDTTLMSDQYIEDDYMFTVLTLRPLSENVTVSVYYNEDKIEEILDSHYNFISDGSNNLNGLK